MVRHQLGLKFGIVPMLLGAVALSGGVGCSVRQGSSEKRGAALEANQNAKRLTEVSDRLAGTLGELSANAKKTDALEARRGAWKALIESENAVEKVSEAGTYLMWFDYQLWTGTGQDSAERREQLAALAAREFMKKVHAFVHPGQTEADPLSSENKARCLNSLAASLHVLNPEQEALVKKDKGVRALSMYSMIQEALRAAVKERQEGSMGKQKMYVREILQYEETAKLLLKVRYNYLGALALVRLVELSKAPAAAAKTFIGGWDVKLESANSTELTLLALHLKAAIKTHDFLVSIGVAPRMSAPLRRLYADMRVPSSGAGAATAPVGSSDDTKSGAKETAAEKEVAQLEFLSMVEGFKKTGLLEEVVPAEVPVAAPVGAATNTGTARSETSVAPLVPVPAPASVLAQEAEPVLEAVPVADTQATSGKGSEVKSANQKLFSFEYMRTRLESLNQFFSSKKP